ncbi:SDR family NAD(P)-dependent oxidoreductase [Pedobacter sp. 22163]|uniref:SDR family NAD(P)-dependent oxidoreductase n=1 Tax=Pedobacter sp. 22163 TaxID=3453883 RepID=UPI003F85B942
MKLLLEDKVAVITGSSQGIGAGIARAFARQGAKVVINYISNHLKADQLVDEIAAHGGKAVAVKANISDPLDIERLFKEAVDTFGKVDILVNNAGILEFELLESITHENMQAQINTNLIGTILSTKKAAELMVNDGGSIINISATTSINPLPGTLVFSATKAAIDNITKVLSKELGKKNIRVNTIAPGMTETDGSHEKGIMGSELEKQNIQLTPLGRIAQPLDIAKVAVFLASDNASWVTGERIQVSGGQL